jgi:hypothetical protein
LTIDLRQEAQQFRDWVALKVADPSRKPSSTVGAIVCLFNYSQGGWIALDFNTDEPFEPDCDVSKSAWDDLFERPTWTPFACADDAEPRTFIGMDGAESSVPAGDLTDDFLCAHLGGMIRDVLTAAWSAGAFSTLPLRPGCELDLWDFNGNWGWHAKEASGKLVTA